MIYDVICPECGFVYHETTPQYDPAKSPKPTMCRLKEPYKSWGWEDFTNDPGAGVGEMPCPGCDCLYASPGGRLIVRPQWEEVDRVSEAADKRQAEIDALFGAEVKAEELTEGVEAEETCPKCGKPESAFKSRSGFVNHKRLCKG